MPNATYFSHYRTVCVCGGADPLVRGRRPRRPWPVGRTPILWMQQPVQGDPRGPGIGVRVRTFPDNDVSTGAVSVPTKRGGDDLTLTPMRGPGGPPHTNRAGIPMLGKASDIGHSCLCFR